MSVLTETVVYYITQKRTLSEGEITREPIYFNPTNNSYSTTPDYEYATKYDNLENVKRRVKVLNMLAELEEDDSNGKITYVPIKCSEKYEEVEGEE